MIEEIVNAAVARCNPATRAAEAELLTKALAKAHHQMTAAGNKPAYTEEVLRVMGRQYTTFRGRQAPAAPTDKRKR